MGLSVWIVWIVIRESSHELCFHCIPTGARLYNVIPYDIMH